MNLPPIDGVEYGDSYMTFSVPHGTCTKRVDYTSSVPNKAKIYYGFKCCVNSIQMAEPITATFHYKQNGEEKTVTNTFAVNDYLISFENMVK